MSTASHIGKPTISNVTTYLHIYNEDIFITTYLQCNLKVYSSIKDHIWGVDLADL